MAQLRNQVLSEEVARCAKSLEEHYIQARRPDARLGALREVEGRGMPTLCGGAVEMDGSR